MTAPTATPESRLNLIRLLLFMFLLTAATSGAAESKRVIHLKSQKIVTTQISPQTLGSLTASAEQPRHFLIQFTRNTTPTERKALAASGIKLHNYVPDLAYWATIEPTARVASLFAGGGIYWARAAAAIDTLAPAIRNNKMPPSALMDDKRYNVVCTVFSDVSRAVAEKEITSVGGEILVWKGTTSASVAISPENVLKLSGLDCVEWVEPSYGPNVPYNVMSAQRSYATELAINPFDLTGAGATVGVWEAEESENAFNVDAHADFEDRLTVVQADPVPSNHATHVAGTIAGAGLGDPLARGFAPALLLKSLGLGEGDGSDTMRSEATAGNVQLSNHSYGTVAGWEFFGNWIFTDDEPFGLYDASASEWDKIVRDTGLIIFKAAGNDRNDGPSPDETDGPWDCIPTYGVAKNIITVGATDDVDNLTFFSSCGPTNDGRVKPDVVANGATLYSTMIGNTYGVMSGTSMASPSACGAGALLFEQFKTSVSAAPSASMLKALLIHGAIDRGNVGPDYEYGWGLVNARKSWDLLFNAQFKEDTFDGVTPLTYPVVVPFGSQVFKATIVWTDPEASPSAEKTLQNDLNIVLRDEFGTVYQPWVLDPATPEAPATTGVNSVDNVEQVFVTSPNGGDWSIEVTGALTVGETQSFSLVCEGLTLSDQRVNTLRVQSDGAPNVAVAVTPPDINAQDNGITSFTRQYIGETTVSLTANTDIPGYRFIGWRIENEDSTESREDSAETIEITFDRNIVATAQFVERPRILVPAEPLRVIEGRTGEFWVRLSGPPPEPVEVLIYKNSGDRDIDLVGPEILFFDFENWSEKQWVTVSLSHDDDILNGGATFRLDGGEIVEGNSFAVLEIDDDDTDDLTLRRNDLFANRRVMTASTVTSIVNNTVLFTRENMEPQIFCQDYNSIRTGGKSAWWQFTPTSTGLMEINTKGSSINTLLGVFKGSDLSNLVFVAGDDDSGGADKTSKLSFMAEEGVKYQIVVDGYRGVAGTYVLNWVQANPLRVIAPNGGETIPRGTVQAIRWSTSPSILSTDRVKIYLYRDNAYLRTITTGTLNDGSFDWLIPDDLDTANTYQICVLSNDKVNRDLSDGMFEIVENAPVITTLTPNGGEQFNNGQSVNVTWTSDTSVVGPSVKIYLYRGAEYAMTITGGTTNDGQYTWIIPQGLPTRSDYRIVLISRADTNIRDYSDSFFSVAPSAIPVVRVISPNGNEQLKAGIVFTVRWVSDAAKFGNEVKVYLYKDGEYFTTLSKGTANDGLYEWTITQPTASGYSIAIISSLDKGMRDYSDNTFKIVP